MSTPQYPGRDSALRLHVTLHPSSVLCTTRVERHERGVPDPGVDFGRQFSEDCLILRMCVVVSSPGE